MYYDLKNNYQITLSTEKIKEKLILKNLSYLLKRKLKFFYRKYTA